MLRQNETALPVFEDITAHTFHKMQCQAGNLGPLKGGNPFCPILGSVSCQVVCSHGTQTPGHLYIPELPQSYYFATLKLESRNDRDQMRYSDD